MKRTSCNYVLCCLPYQSPEVMIISYMERIALSVSPISGLFGLTLLFTYQIVQYRKNYCWFLFCNKIKCSEMNFWKSTCFWEYYAIVLVCVHYKTMFSTLALYGCSFFQSARWWIMVSPLQLHLLQMKFCQQNSEVFVAIKVYSFSFIFFYQNYP